MKFKQGDIVRFITGKVDWEVDWPVDPIAGWRSGYYILKSPMSGRRRSAYEHELKAWVPHE